MGSQIHHHKNSWWFWDETHTNRHGPHRSKKEAKRCLKIYTRFLDKEITIEQAKELIQKELRVK